jgi:hypothetical protein
MTEFARQNGAAQGDDIFSATQGKHGKNSFEAQNRRNSSQIDPCNQVLIGSFPMVLAGKNIPCQHAGREVAGKNSHLSRESIWSMAKTAFDSHTYAPVWSFSGSAGHGIPRDRPLSPPQAAPIALARSAGST